MTDTVVRVLDDADIQSRVRELGEEISAAYGERTPMLVGVLSGSVPMLADLARAMKIDVDIDFIALNRFGEGGRVRFVLDTESPVLDRDVLIVEDIIDTGLTLQTMRGTFLARGARSVQVVTLLNKASRRIVDVPVDFRGFDVGDEFLVGYGLDWEGRYRNLRSIWAVMDFESFAADSSVLDLEAFPPVGDNLQA